MDNEQNKPKLTPKDQLRAVWLCFAGYFVLALLDISFKDFDPVPFVTGITGWLTVVLGISVYKNIKGEG